MARKTTTKPTLRIIPEYRDEIDTKKLCRILVSTARDMAKQKHKDKK